jgi:hypothetical protein
MISTKRNSECSIFTQPIVSSRDASIPTYSKNWDWCIPRREVQTIDSGGAKDSEQEAAFPKIRESSGLK